MRTARHCSRWMMAAMGFALAAGSSLAPAQQAAQPLKFEVASIKPTKAPVQVDKMGISLPPRMEFLPGGLFRATGVTFLDLLTLVQPGKHQFEGGPSWIDTDRFDILAQADLSRGPIEAWSDGGQEQWVEMIDNLVKERFALKSHQVIREKVVSVLTSRRPPARLQEHMTNLEYPIQPAGGGRLQFSGASLPDLARYLSRVLHAEVVDGTGITGFFDFELDPYRYSLGGTDIKGNTYSDLIVNAVNDLGFELHRQKLSVAYTIIDDLEQPTDD